MLLDASAAAPLLIILQASTRAARLAEAWKWGKVPFPATQVVQRTHAHNDSSRISSCVGDPDKVGDVCVWGDQLEIPCKVR